MTITIRGTTPATSGTTSNPVSVSLTGARQPNASDVLLIIHSNNFYGFANMATPTVGGSTTGVTAVTGGSIDVGADSPHIKSYTYVVGSTGDLTVSATETGSADEEKGLFVYVLSAVDTTTPIDVAGTFTDSADPMNAPSISPTSADAYLICHVTSDSGDPFTPPAGMAERYDSNVGGFISFSGATLQLSASGATGIKSFDATGPSQFATLSVAIKTGTAASAASPLPPRLPFPLTAPLVGPHVRPLQLYGNAVTDQWPALTETASAADSLTVAAVLSFDDATSAAVDSLALAAAVPLAEATNATTDELSAVRPNDPYQSLPVQDWALLNPGTGPHAPILQLLGDASGGQTPTLTDTGTADDLLGTDPQIPFTETATAADSLTATVTLPLDETATATDSVTVSASFTVDDSGTGTDSLTAQAIGGTDSFQSPRFLPGMFLNPKAASPQTLGDAATGVVGLPDAASGADVLVVAGGIPLTETASGSDTVTVAATGTLPDTGSAGDTLAVSVTLPLDDSATGVDALAVSMVGAPDSHQWVPLQPVDPPPLQLLGDASSGAAPVSLTDDATAADSLSIAITITMADTATASDSLSSVAGPLLTELVSAADSLAIAVVLSMTEAASAVDSLFIGGSGIQGNVRPRGDRSSSGNAYPRGSRAIIGSGG